MNLKVQPIEQMIKLLWRHCRLNLDALESAVHDDFCIQTLRTRGTELGRPFQAT